MERRFELRKGELMADCEVHPAVFAGMMSRLERFAEPFAERLRRPEQREHAQTYLQGLLSDVEQKNAEAIEQYEIFLEIWKDADPELAEVTEARERLEALRRNLKQASG